VTLILISRLNPECQLTIDILENVRDAIKRLANNNDDDDDDDDDDADEDDDDDEANGGRGVVT
jgi:ABC-type Zn2+ transport system substrate-binding protein/surface adhesin